MASWPCRTTMIRAAIPIRPVSSLARQKTWTPLARSTIRSCAAWLEPHLAQRSRVGYSLITACFPITINSYLQPLRMTGRGGRGTNRPTRGSLKTLMLPRSCNWVMIWLTRTLCISTTIPIVERIRMKLAKQLSWLWAMVENWTGSRRQGDVLLCVHVYIYWFGCRI
jgi:hypothetical protein